MCQTTAKQVMRIVYTLLLLCLVTICQSQILVSSDSTIVTEYRDGKLWAYQNIDSLVIGITGYEAKDNYGKYYQINVFAKNISDTSILFSPDEIYAQLVNNRNDTISLEVYTNEEFQKKVSRSQSWAMALTAFSSGLNAGMAGYTTSYSTSYAGGIPYTSVTTSYNASAAHQANMASTNQIIALGKMMEDDRTNKEHGYLKMTTLHPSEGLIGYMNIKFKKGQLLTVKIPLGGRLYSFVWDVRKKNKK